MKEHSELALKIGIQQIYLSRLMAKLRRRRIERDSGGRTAGISAADISLASAARGRDPRRSGAIILARTGKTKISRLNDSRSTWKRRLLKSKRNFKVHFNRLGSVRRLSKPAWCSTSPRRHGDEEQGVESRLETLRTIVPGSRGLDTPVLLAEVADYIMKLKLQVESMQALASHLTNSLSSASSCPM